MARAASEPFVTENAHKAFPAALGSGCAAKRTNAGHIKILGEARGEVVRLYDANKNLRLVIDVKGLRNEEQARRIEVFKLQYPALPFEVWNLYVLRKKGIFDSNKGGQMARAASTDL